MAKRKGTNKENLEETRKNFLKAGLKEFCECSYANASTSRIVQTSDMARGSLYYHFGDKQGLFVAIYEDLMNSSYKDVVKVMDAENDAWASFVAGSLKFLDFSKTLAFRKIVLIESQTAMTIEKRIEILERTFLGKLRAIIEELISQGYFQGHTAHTVTVIVFGILGEIGRAIHYVGDPDRTLEEFSKSYIKTIESMAKAD